MFPAQYFVQLGVFTHPRELHREWPSAGSRAVGDNPSVVLGHLKGHTAKPNAASGSNSRSGRATNLCRSIVIATSRPYGNLPRAKTAPRHSVPSNSRSRRMDAAASGTFRIGYCPRSPSNRLANSFKRGVSQELPRD
jgi:hypothetical protein